MSDDNIWNDDWGEQGEDWSGGGGKSKRLPRAQDRPGLGATVAELGPGNFVVDHFHHAWEEHEVVEYPDLGQITTQARTGSVTGECLWLIHDVEQKGEK